jgi:hypothetical protein
VIKVIGFTGHRNVLCDEDHLVNIENVYGSNAVWVHGGAVGFDSQVADYAKLHNIAQVVLEPLYDLFDGRKAPVYRNCAIVRCCQQLVACYDGRIGGGTRFTIDYAVKFNKPVLIIKPDRYIKGQQWEK